MSDHNPTHGHDPHGHEQVESSAVKPKPVLMFLVILGVSTAFVFVLVKGMEWAFDWWDQSKQETGATAIKDQRKLPPEPRLQGAPGTGSTTDANVPTMLPLEEAAKFRKDTEEAIKAYGPVKDAPGFARVPVERAKEMIAEQGLPSLPTTTISDELQKAEAARKQVMNADSSAGRIIKAQPK
jgi:hypothetical protein